MMKILYFISINQSINNFIYPRYLMRTEDNILKGKLKISYEKIRIMLQLYRLASLYFVYTIYFQETISDVFLRNINGN